VQSGSLYERRKWESETGYYTTKPDTCVNVVVVTGLQLPNCEHDTTRREKTLNSSGGGTRKTDSQSARSTAVETIAGEKTNDKELVQLHDTPVQQ